MIYDFSDGRPPISVSRTRPLLFEILKYASPILLDPLDVPEEGIALRSKDSRTKLPSWGPRGYWGVERIEHCNAVGFVERFQTHFVDEGLFIAYKPRLSKFRTLIRTYPTTETDVHLRIISFRLLFLGLHLKHPLYYLGAVFT